MDYYRDSYANEEYRDAYSNVSITSFVTIPACCIDSSTKQTEIHILTVLAYLAGDLRIPIHAIYTGNLRSVCKWVPNYMQAAAQSAAKEVENSQTPA